MQFRLLSYDAPAMADSDRVEHNDGFKWAHFQKNKKKNQGAVVNLTKLIRYRNKNLVSLMKQQTILSVFIAKMKCSHIGLSDVAGMLQHISNVKTTQL